MKVRIIKDKHIYINDVVSVVNEDEKFYYVQGITGIFSVNKEDAEVVEEKSCDNCLIKLAGCERDWCTADDRSGWKAIPKNSVVSEDIQKKYNKLVNDLNSDKPLNYKQKPLIKLIKISEKSKFTKYINVNHIISITPTDYGVSIKTSDNDGDYMAVDNIDDVLAKLGYDAN